jgi:predicted KAP-like P-loop ATPase
MEGKERQERKKGKRRSTEASRRKRNARKTQSAISLEQVDAKLKTLYSAPP